MIQAYKKVGQTPLELLNEIRKEHPELADEPLSYAGRLDPMAEGEMNILVGKEENQNREQYLISDKEYVTDIIFGFSTDTYDLLGLVTDSLSGFHLDNVNVEKLKEIKVQKYPDFSSKTVNGKPLFEWKKEGRIDEIEVPERGVEIKEAELLEEYEISSSELLKYIIETVLLVNGDFRQEEIINKWKSVLKDDFNIPVMKVRFKVSTGTYIRGLADTLGKDLKIPASLFKLKRTKIYE